MEVAQLDVKLEPSKTSSRGHGCCGSAPRCQLRNCTRKKVVIWTVCILLVGAGLGVGLGLGLKRPSEGFVAPCPASAGGCMSNLPGAMSVEASSLTSTGRRLLQMYVRRFRVSVSSRGKGWGPVEALVGLWRYSKRLN